MKAASPLDRAAECIQQYPLCLQDRGGSWSDRGFFAGVDECIESLNAFVSAKIKNGTAFGRSWPFLESEGHILAPAIPIAVPPTEIMAPDGAYQRREAVIERESAGLVENILILHPGSNSPHSAFDLLWFADHERFILQGESLTISSLFADFGMTARRRTLDRMLRFFDLGDDPLDQWQEMTAQTEPASVTVGRPQVYISEDRWKKPEAYLARRPDVKEVQLADSSVIVTATDDAKVLYRRIDTKTGWKLELLEGRSLYTGIDMNLTSENLILNADLHPSLDASRSDVRARIAFDLNADLQKL